MLRRILDGFFWAVIGSLFMRLSRRCFSSCWPGSTYVMHMLSSCESRLIDASSKSSDVIGR